MMQYKKIFIQLSNKFTFSPWTWYVWHYRRTHTHTHTHTMDQKKGISWSTLADLLNERPLYVQNFLIWIRCSERRCFMTLYLSDICEYWGGKNERQIELYQPFLTSCLYSFNYFFIIISNIFYSNDYFE